MRSYALLRAILTLLHRRASPWMRGGTEAEGTSTLCMEITRVSGQALREALSGPPADV